MATKIFVDGEGLSALEIVELEDGKRLDDIIMHFAEKTGRSREDLVLLLEDKGEPLDLNILIEDHPHKHLHHHVHTHKELEVVVHYANLSERRRYPPSTRVQTVLEWAVTLRAFRIDPSKAGEMVLTLPGQSEALTGSDHIGRYTKGKVVEFNLAAGQLHQG